MPYRGVNLAMQDLLAGQIDMMIDLAANSLTQVRAGNVKAYGVTAKSRLAAAPDVPTVDEAGLPGFYTSVACPFCPQGHTEDRHRQPQCRGRGCVGRSGGALALCRSRHGASAARATDAGSARRLSQGRNCEVWPIIKTANIKAE